MKKQSYIYIDIQKDIIADIHSGKYKTGDLMPSENEIAEKYGVARMTAHKALKELENKGFLVAKKGSGYYLKAITNDKHFTLKSFTERAEEEKKTNIINKLLVYKQVKQDTQQVKEIANLLLCPPYEKFHYFERLRLENDAAIVYEIIYVPMSRIPKIDINCMSRSFYNYVENELNLVIKGGNSLIMVEQSDEKINKLFGR